MNASSESGLCANVNFSIILPFAVYINITEVLHFFIPIIARYNSQEYLFKVKPPVPRLVRYRTVEEVWASLPKWIKAMIKEEEKILKEALLPHLKIYLKNIKIAF
jgi:hypothetical protein